jgi:hypothetical protein
VRCIDAVHPASGSLVVEEICCGARRPERRISQGFSDTFELLRGRLNEGYGEIDS